MSYNRRNMVDGSHELVYFQEKQLHQFHFCPATIWGYNIRISMNVYGPAEPSATSNNIILV